MKDSRGATSKPAFADFAVAQTSALLRFATVLTGDLSTAEDLVQDTLLAMLRRWDSLADPARADAYARRAITNRWIDLSRRRRRFAGIGAPPVSLYEVDFLAYDGDREFFNRLAVLTPKQRAVLTLRYYCDWPDNRIASALRCREATVRSQAWHALARLRSDATSGGPDEPFEEDDHARA